MPTRAQSDPDLPETTVDPGDAMVDALVQSAFDTTAALSRIAADNDLSLTSLRLLGVLRGRRLRMSALADHLGLERSTMSGLIDRAEARGLVRRAPGERDRRVSEVSLAPDGVALANRIGSTVREALAPRTNRLDAGEQAALTALLEQTVTVPAIA